MLGAHLTIRMDNVLIVVDDLEAAKAFFTELGMELEGETTVEGPAVDRTIGLHDVRADIAMMRAPDGAVYLFWDTRHSAPERARDLANELTDRLREGGFSIDRVLVEDLRPVPVVCAMGRPQGG